MQAIRLVTLCCLCGFLFACGEVGGVEFTPNSSSSKNNANSSSSDAGSSSSSYNLNIVWKSPEGVSKVHGNSDVHVDGYMISENLITQKQYKAVMNENPAMNKNDNLPIEGVTWFKAVEFCNKLSAIMGLKENAIRLPTEAEWEIATYIQVVQRNDNYWEWTNDCFDSKFPWEEDNPKGPPNCLPNDPKVRKGLGSIDGWEDRFSTNPNFSNIGGGYISFRIVVKKEDFQ